MHFYSVLIILLFLTGCAVTPTKTTHTSNELKVYLSRADNSVYSLVDERGKAISRSNGNGQVLRFEIPKQVNLNQCFSVTNGKRENVYGSKKIALPLANEFGKVRLLKAKIESRINDTRSSDKFYQRQFGDVSSSLKSSRAYKNGRCSLPPQRLLPREPYTRCESHAVCKEEGSAICYSRFFKSEGCAIALREVGNVSGILASPSCSASVAALAGEKYDLGDAIVDALHGAVDDYAAEQLESDSVWANIWGGLVGITNYSVKFQRAETCANNFVETFYGPKLRWANEVKRIQNEPESLRQDCLRNIRVKTNYEAKIKDIDEELRDLYVSLNHITAVHDALSTDVADAPLCTGRNVSLGIVKGQSVNRYLIGAVLKDTSSGQVEIRELLKNMPAMQSGLHNGDRIIQVDDQPIKNKQSFIAYLQKYGHRSINLYVDRRGNRQRITIKPELTLIQLKGV